MTLSVRACNEGSGVVDPETRREIARLPSLNEELVVAADFGTTSVKVGLVDAGMNLIAHRIETYPLDLNSGGQAEQNPEDWWHGFASAVAKLAEAVPDLRSRVGAVVFCGQMCGLVCTDSTGRPLRPCLIWQDKRSAALSRKLVGGKPEVHGYHLGRLLRWIWLANGAPSRNGMDPTGKLKFIQLHEADVFERTHKFLDVKDWLIHRATGRFVTTADSANLTWLMDTRPRREGWSPTLAKSCDIPLEKMADIVDGTEVVGTLSDEAAQSLGLDPKVKVVAGGGDVTATALGSGAHKDGELHLCVSSSSWISGFFPKRVLSVPHSFATITSSLGFRPLLIATQESAGSSLEWIVRTTNGSDGGPTSADLNAAFDGVGPARPDDPYVIPWFAGERVPVDNDALRGAVYGLSLNHDTSAIRRAAIEGVALNLRWAYSVVDRKVDVATNGALPLVGGGAANPLLVQTIADSLNQDVAISSGRFAGVLGVAAIAAPAMGWAKDPWQAAKPLKGRETRRFTPEPERVTALNDRYRHLESIRRDLMRGMSSKVG